MSSRANLYKRTIFALSPRIKEKIIHFSVEIFTKLGKLISWNIDFLTPVLTPVQN